MRKVFGIVVGIVVAIILHDTLWRAATGWFPPAMPNDGNEDLMMRDMVVLMPLGGQIMIALGWFVLGFVTAWAALRVAQWRPAGWITGAVVLYAAIWNLFTIGQPWWVMTASIVLPLAGVWLAERYFHRARPGDPLIS